MYLYEPENQATLTGNMVVVYFVSRIGHFRNGKCISYSKQRPCSGVREAPSFRLSYVFFCHDFFSVTRHLIPIELGASGGAIYLPYLVLHHTA